MKNNTEKIVGLTLIIIITFWITTNEVISLSHDYKESEKIINEYFDKKSDAGVASATKEVSLSGNEDNISSHGDEQSSPSIKEIGEFSAYNAEVGQTDSDPTTMASGKQVYDGAIANNCLPFGTEIEVKGIVFIVEDRMNSRYGCEHFDIFVEGTREEALEFGRQKIAYKVLNK